MKAFYLLKKSDPTDLVEPIVKYLEQVQSQGKAFSFRQNLAKITQLRNKTTSLSFDEPSLQVINKYIPALEMYVRYALLLSKHLNWNKQYGPIVDDLKIVWYDSFNPQVKFMKLDINFDIFCCYYNLGIMYLYKAAILALQQLDTPKKESITCGKAAYYLFNRMRTYYYSSFVNTGFSDTDYSHLQLLESLAQGIVYKNMFKIFKENEYKIGIDKVASLAGLAQKNFYHAYEIASAYFMKSSSIKPAVKAEILSLAYVQSLYYDLMFNTRLAKYYEEEMDNNKDNIIYLIAYQKKAVRLLDLGLKNESVAHLLNSRPEQKKQLMKIRPEIEQSLKTNIKRNKQIYKKEQIKEQQIPVPKDPPSNYLIKAEEPASLKISYQGPLASPFADLIDNESKGLMNQLKDFARNRMLGLESAYTKLNKIIEAIYNDNFVNYYINLQNNNKTKGIPEALKQKLKLIQLSGGKQKLDMEVNILRKNSEQAAVRLNQFKKLIMQQESFDNSKRGQYGNKWRRQPSAQINSSYKNEIEIYQKKSETANIVNKKIIDKYESLKKYINVVDQNDQTILSVLPKVQITKFLEQNKGLFDSLKSGIAVVKDRHDGLDAIVDQIRGFYEKMNFSDIASKYYKKLEQSNKQKIFDQIFSKTYKLIEAFNQKSKIIENEAKKVGEISQSLNSKNKGDEKNKKEFQQVVSKFNDVNNLFKDLNQGTAFYTKLSEVLVRIGDTIEGFITARKIDAQELQNSINKGGFGFGGNNLPNMYPNQPQQNLGFYVPPPMNFNNGQNNMNFSSFGNNNNNGGNMADMLQDIMRSKPSFSADVFGGQVYHSKFM